jgi:hypothetical protein
MARPPLEDKMKAREFMKLRRASRDRMEEPDDWSVNVYGKPVKAETSLEERYELKFGKKPHARMKPETMRVRLEE